MSTVANDATYLAAIIYTAAHGKVLIWVKHSKLPIWQAVSHTGLVVEIHTRHRESPLHRIEAIVVGLDELSDKGCQLVEHTADAFGAIFRFVLQAAVDQGA